MRTKHNKNKSRSKPKRHRSLRKKSGGGIADWFNSTPSDPADDARPLHERALNFFTNIFSSASAPPVPENVAPPPRPGQPPVKPVEPPGEQIAPVGPQIPADEKKIVPVGPQIPVEQQIPTPMQPSSSPIPPMGNQFSSSTAFGGKRTKKRRNHKKK